MALFIPPTYRFAFAPDGAITVFEGDLASVSPLRFHLDDLPIATALRARMPLALADLADVAMAVYVADRLSRRRSATNAGRWARRIEIEVPVRDPDLWGDPAVATALHDALWAFTEDEWHLRFVARVGHQRAAEMQPPLFVVPVDASTTVALFSGGLDSLAGLGRDAIERPFRELVLVSGSTNPRLTGVQRTLIASIRDRMPSAVVPIEMPFGLRRNGDSYDTDEPTQRARGVLFLVLGAVAAMAAGRDELTVYENGVGAINLPYTAAQRGAQHSRATSPYALVALQQLISRVSGRPFRFRLPFLFATKGDLCASLAPSALGALIGGTVSCDGFPSRVEGISHCGVCTSCLLRRQSLHAAGLDEGNRGAAYRWDVTDPRAAIPATKWYPLRLMYDQVETLRGALSAPDPWRSLSRQFPELVDVVAAAPSLGHTADVERQLVALYRRYCDEWRAFPAHPRGALSALAA